MARPPPSQITQNGHAAIVRDLVESGANMHQQHEPTGISAPIVAVMSGQREVLERLLAADLVLSDLPNEVRDQATQLLKSNTGRGEHADADSAREGAFAPMLAYAWTIIDAGTIWSEIAAALEEGRVHPEAFKRVAQCESADPGVPQCSIRTLQFVQQLASAVVLCDLTWWRVGNLPPILLHPGFDLDAAIIDAMAATQIDWRQDSEAQMLAAFAVTIAGARVIGEHETLPTASDGNVISTGGYSEDHWRPWRHSSSPVGRTIELPAAVENRLVRIKVLVPEGGVGARVLPGETVIARNVQWHIPPFAMDETGSVLPYRLLGVMQENAS